MIDPPVTQNDQGDFVCQHGTSMDVHCCNCHSGFLFDVDACVCEFDPPVTIPSGPEHERMFPIMGRFTATWAAPIPWRVIAPHEAQAEWNHSQSLEILAQRGGLSPGEAVAVLEDRPWRRMDSDEAESTLRRIVEANS